MMKKVSLFVIISSIAFTGFVQPAKTELYDLVKKLLYDSTGYPSVGEWAVGEPKKFPIKFKEDYVVMSDDTAINFYRTGTVDLMINGRSFKQNSQPVKWTIMLKGPRMGYTSFSIISSPSNELQPKYNIDSLFGKKNFKATLLKSCESKTFAGYYYYELKLPKKDMAFLKVSWVSLNGNTAIRIDGFDDNSKHAAKLDCPK